MSANDLDLITRVARRMVTSGDGQDAQMLGHHVLTLVEEYEALRARIAKLDRMAFLDPTAALADALRETA